LKAIFNTTTKKALRNAFWPEGLCSAQLKLPNPAQIIFLRITPLPPAAVAGQHTWYVGTGKKAGDNRLILQEESVCRETDKEKREYEQLMS
jgi:hypothetical protein